jgi:hypothetical protein
MKGQSTQLLMFSIVIVGVTVGLLSFSQMLAAPGILASSLDDPPMVVEAQTQSDNIVAHFLPLAAHYSVAQGAWNESTNPENILTNGTFDNHYSWTLENVSTVSNQVLDDSYTRPGGFYNVDRCNIEIPPKDITIYKTSTNISINKSDESEPLVRTECFNDENQVVNVRQKPDSLNTTYPNIRLHKLLIITLNGTKAAYDEAVEDENSGEAEDEGDNGYYGEVNYTLSELNEDACISLDEADDPEEAKEAAKDEISQRASGLIDSRVSRELGDYQGAYNSRIENMGQSDSSGGGGLISGIIDFVTFWSPGNNGGNYSWDPSILSNSTYIEQEGDVAASKCACEGNWRCTDPWTVGGNPPYEDTYPGPDCEPVPDAECPHEDGNASDGECSKDDYLDEYDRPDPVCENGDYSDGECEGSDNPPECTQHVDDDDDYDFEFNSSMDMCQWADETDNDGDDITEDPECTESGMIHDGNGGCQASGDPPTAECQNEEDITYSAEVKYYWEIESFKFGSIVEDLQNSIPVRDGWKNLYMNRTFNYSFPESGERPQ